MRVILGDPGFDEFFKLPGFRYEFIRFGLGYDLRRFVAQFVSLAVWVSPVPGGVGPVTVAMLMNKA